MPPERKEQYVLWPIRRSTSVSFHNVECLEVPGPATLIPDILLIMPRRTYITALWSKRRFSAQMAAIKCHHQWGDSAYFSGYHRHGIPVGGHGIPVNGGLLGSTMRLRFLIEHKYSL